MLWEAQFGDFVNSAQVIVDQFIVSGLAKWGQTSRLTLLLPHGYEGSGPEHSSARLERFLALAAEGNIRVANPTTPAQYFHLLRRQARIAKQRPLVIMTPKSLLRLPQATNRIADLAEDALLPGARRAARADREGHAPGAVHRQDLLRPRRAPERAGQRGVAVGRVELLYPFPEAQILELIDSYPNLREVVWVQEEPRNMGARAHMFPRLMQIMPEHLHFGYIGRPERASPGEGYPAAHIAEQNRIVAPRSTCRSRSRCTREDAGRALTTGRLGHTAPRRDDTAAMPQHLRDGARVAGRDAALEPSELAPSRAREQVRARHRRDVYRGDERRVARGEALDVADGERHRHHGARREALDGHSAGVALERAQQRPDGARVERGAEVRRGIGLERAVGCVAHAGRLGAAPRTGRRARSP